MRSGEGCGSLAVVTGGWLVAVTTDVTDGHGCFLPRMSRMYTDANATDARMYTNVYATDARMYTNVYATNARMNTNVLRRMSGMFFADAMLKFSYPNAYGN